MSTLKRKNVTGDSTLKKHYFELVTCTSVLAESQNLSLNCPSPECEENNCEDSVSSTEGKGDPSKENGYLLIGEHENQVSEGGEEDLPNFKRNCKKNPGHPDFITIESFSLEHLPEDYCDGDLYELIKAAADLTVRIDVNMTSPERPDFWPDTRIPYFLSGMRGKKILRTGSGMVIEVRKLPDEYDDGGDNGTCPCDKCKASDKPSDVWWKIAVNSATHVVFDDIEASHTKLKLFYDKEGSEVVILKDKVCIDIGSVVEDWCRMNCVTCDVDLGNKLEKMQKRYEEVWIKIQDKYKESRDNHKLNFIVSHPHGCSKQISVGQWKDNIQVGDHKLNNKFTYTTCTCPGSSGAAVHCVGYSGWSDYAHSGSLKSGLNVSGANYVFPGEDLEPEDSEPEDSEPEDLEPKSP